MTALLVLTFGALVIAGALVTYYSGVDGDLGPVTYFTRREAIKAQRDWADWNPNQQEVRKVALDLAPSLGEARATVQRLTDALTETRRACHCHDGQAAEMLTEEQQRHIETQMALNRANAALAEMRQQRDAVLGTYAEAEKVWQATFAEHQARRCGTCASARRYMQPAGSNRVVCENEASACVWATWPADHGCPHWQGTGRGRDGEDVA